MPASPVCLRWHPVPALAHSSCLQPHGQVERQVKPYNRAIKGAMAAGTITCWRTLEVVLTSALITQTQLMVTYGSTAFTRCTGAVPRTHRDLYTSACDNVVELKPNVEEDAGVLSALQFYVDELCDWHQHRRDMAHRTVPEAFSNSEAAGHRLLSR